MKLQTLAMWVAISVAPISCVVVGASHHSAANHPPGPGYQPYAELYVSSAPPPHVVEAVPPPPDAGLVWLEGYWDWTGYDWFWVSGRWLKPLGGFAFVAPRYALMEGRWIYYRGHWRHESNGQRDYQYGLPPPPPPHRKPTANP